jgi:hypothetical protein
MLLTETWIQDSILIFLLKNEEEGGRRQHQIFQLTVVWNKCTMQCCHDTGDIIYIQIKDFPKVKLQRQVKNEHLKYTVLSLLRKF